MMRLIGTNEFLRREWVMRAGMQVNINVLDLRDDETIEYAILSHRWIDAEVSYEEMVDLAMVEKGKRDEIRGRLGYKKILDTCRQAQKDGYEWVWVDTCCIDKRNSAELSETINSMYRWYGKAKACYTYLHDVDGPSFPTEQDREKYPKWNGWPEWFSRGWTLQEMIAPIDVQFFNENWQPIGTKKALATTLSEITGVPERILTDGLDGNCPCVAQIMSWAANRTTTRVEDRAYSLMGLLDVNMPMLYGEGKKAFHRLQLEIIRSSNDQSIFAWGHAASNVRIGSILADDPSSFRDCSYMMPLDDDTFIRQSKQTIPGLRLVDTESDDGVFLVTKRGIQIRMLLCPYRGSKFIFRAYLPCQFHGSLVTINLVLWNSYYYRYPNARKADLGDSTEFHQVYLRYQDTPNHAVTFDIDGSGLAENAGNFFTLTNANPFHVETYSEKQGNGCFKVVFGQCLGQDWLYLADFPPGAVPNIDEEALIAQGPDRALPVSNTFRVFEYHGLWIRHFHLPGSWVVRIYRVVEERSKIRLRIEMFQDSHFRSALDKWELCLVDVSDFLVHMDC